MMLKLGLPAIALIAAASLAACVATVNGKEVEDAANEEDKASWSCAQVKAQKIDHT